MAAATAISATAQVMMKPRTVGMYRAARMAPIARTIGSTASAKVARPYWKRSRNSPVGVVLIEISMTRQ